MTSVRGAEVYLVPDGTFAKKKLSAKTFYLFSRKSFIVGVWETPKFASASSGN